MYAFLGFRSELNKIAASDNPDVTRMLAAALDSQDRAERLEGLLDASKKSAYPKAIAAGALEGFGMPFLYGVLPTLQGRKALEEAVQQRVNEKYLTAAVEDILGLSGKDARGTAQSIMGFMKSKPAAWTSAGEEALKSLRLARGTQPAQGAFALMGQGGTPIVGQMGFRTSGEGLAQTLRQAGMGGDVARRYVMESSPSVVPAFPEGMEWRNIIEDSREVYKRKHGKLPKSGARLKILSKILAEKSVGAARSALPFALLGGGLAALRVRSKRQQAEDLRRRIG